ncbi:MAG: hypothetical protein ACKVOP_07875 [Sphingomonadaceae bacterium]
MENLPAPEVGDLKDIAKLPGRLQIVSVLGPILVAIGSLVLNFVQQNENSEVQSQLRTAEIELQRSEQGRQQRYFEYLTEEAKNQTKRIVELAKYKAEQERKGLTAESARLQAEAMKDKAQILKQKTEAAGFIMEVQRADAEIEAATSRRAQLEVAMGQSFSRESAK